MTKDAELFINKALEIGFETAKEIDTGTLAVRKDVREMSAPRQSASGCVARTNAVRPTKRSWCKASIRL